MITRLSVKDYAIIRELDLPLKPGLTVITGETGAGKSILVKALGLALGGKALKTDLRSGQERAVVEVEHRESQETFLFRRVISRSGRTRSFINDEPIKETPYRLRAKGVADFHGQHEQQYIMDSETHIDFLDSFCNHEAQVEEIKTCCQTILEKQKQLDQMVTQLASSANERALLEFQIQEIDSVHPEIGEDIELSRELKTLSHMDELVEAVAGMKLMLVEGDQSIYQKLSDTMQSLERLSRYDESLRPLRQLFDQAAITIQEATAALVQHVNELDHDPARLRDIEERLGSIETLKRKYGGSLEAVQEFRQNAEKTFSRLEHLDEDIALLKKELTWLLDKYRSMAVQLHQTRREYSGKLETAIEKEMATLNMPDARFRVELTLEKDDNSPLVVDANKVKIGQKGFDKVVFLLSANPGEDPKPLQYIASGGEISRIMLAIKSVLQANDPVETLIFDEIDSGISGQAAEKVAESLHRLSREKQVLCITHLPQIASRADHHLYVQKQVTGNQTEVRFSYLTAEEKVQAVAELFSGAMVTDETRSTAKKFLDMARG
jgi:DNA repair protein RecN (Recombination protein N)